jgi:hypothetical protein
VCGLAGEAVAHFKCGGYKGGMFGGESGWVQGSNQKDWAQLLYWASKTIVSIQPPLGIAMIPNKADSREELRRVLAGACERDRGRVWGMKPRMLTQLFFFLAGMTRRAPGPSTSVAMVIRELRIMAFILHTCA